MFDGSKISERALSKLRGAIISNNPEEFLQLLNNAYEQDPDLAKRLVKSEYDSTGNTFLHWAKHRYLINDIYKKCACGDSADLVCWLREQEAKGIIYQSSDKEKFLEKFFPEIEKTYRIIIEKLLEIGADPKSENKDQRNPDQFARFQSDLDSHKSFKLIPKSKQLASSIIARTTDIPPKLKTTPPNVTEARPSVSSQSYGYSASNKSGQQITDEEKRRSFLKTLARNLYSEIPQYNAPGTSGQTFNRHAHQNFKDRFGEIAIATAVTLHSKDTTPRPSFREDKIYNYKLTAAETKEVIQIIVSKYNENKDKTTEQLTELTKFLKDSLPIAPIQQPSNSIMPSESSKLGRGREASKLLGF
jgi:hypothetical protein